MSTSFANGITYTYESGRPDLVRWDIKVNYDTLTGPPSPSIIPLASHLLLTAGTFIASRYASSPLQKRCVPAAFILTITAVIHIWMFCQREDKLIFTLRSSCQQTLQEGQFVLLSTRPGGRFDASGYIVRVYKDKVIYTPRLQGWTAKPHEYPNVVPMQTALGLGTPK
jgi:hypothetical protein